MTSVSQTQFTVISQRELWQRWMLFWYGLFYVSLIIATGLSLTPGSFSWEKSTALLGLSLLLGVWYGICIVLPSGYWQQHVWLTLGYLAIGWLLWFALVNLNPAYLFVLVGLYPQNFVLLVSPWSLIGGFSLLLLSLWYQVSRLGGWTQGAFFTLGTGIGGMLMALFVETLLRQSEERARLIEELEATRQELAMVEREAGTMQERHRLAREIHDTFAQGFTSIVMQVEALEVGEGVVKRTLEQVQRIEQLGGTLTLESISGEGTTVAIALPALSNLSLLESTVG
jgi:signal transduction histidine kinase